VDNAHRGLWEEIRTKKVLDDALRASLKAVIEEFKVRFVADQPAVAAHA
jgi:F0F1-type ATP synthase alpha subunit